MRTKAFASRCAKEIVRDPLSLMFGIGFPVILLVFMNIMKRSIKDMPQNMYTVDVFGPGMIVFGLSFLMLFLGMLVMNDRNSSFLPRLYSSPLTPANYILGYTLPMIPIGLAQTVICFIVAIILGLKISVNLLAVMLIMIPVTILFAGLGLLFGSVFNGGALNGVCTILINVVAWLSGTWFSLDMVGDKFRTVCYCLPFAHAVSAASEALNGDYSNLLVHLLVITGYAVVIYVLAAFMFKKQMKN